jgi:sirohydrochlorin cobaltochelatase
MEAVASHMQQIAPAVQVRCAYLELSAPDLPTCVAELAGRDVTSITLTPMFSASM